MTTQSHLSNNYITSLKQSLEVLKDIAKTGGFHTELKGVSERLDDLYPRIMFFGIYNAGKSTLINALMGKKVAEVADIPMTSKINKYTWQNHILYDTPGIDAPIEHEEMSVEHRDKCDVIVFVMSTNGTFDTRKNYVQMMEVIQKEKRLTIVLNNKSGLKATEDEDQITQIKLKIFENLKNMAEELKQENFIQHFIQNCDVFLVNAKTALKGRLEQKNKLVEVSGILELEKEIHSQISQIDSAQIVSKLVEKSVNPYIDELIDYFQEKLSSSLVQVKVEQFLKKLRKKAEKIVQTLYKDLEITKEDMIKVLYHLHVENAPTQHVFSEFQSQISQNINEQFKALSQEVKNDLKDLGEYIKKQSNINFNLEEFEPILALQHSIGWEEFYKDNIQKKSPKLNADLNDNHGVVTSPARKDASPEKIIQMISSIPSLSKILPQPIPGMPNTDILKMLSMLLGDDKEEEEAFRKRQEALEKENANRRHLAEYEAVRRNQIFSMFRNMIRNLIEQTQQKNERIISQFVKELENRVQQQIKDEYDVKISNILANISDVRDNINQAVRSIHAVRK